MSASDLTEQQRSFCDHYVNCLSGVRSAELAGYGGTRDSLYVQASQLLSLPKVKEYLAAKFAERILSPEELLTRLSLTANANMADFTDSAGNIDLARVKDLGLGQLVREIAQTRDGTKIKLHDAMRAQELLIRYHGLLTDRVDITSDGKRIVTEESIDKLSDIIARATERDDA